MTANSRGRAATITGLLILAPAAVAQVHLRPVARSDQPSPGLPPVYSFDWATINDLGGVAVKGNAWHPTGVPGQTLADFIASGTTGAWSLHAREFDHAPGTPLGVEFDALGQVLVLADTGRVAFSAQLAGVTPESSNGIWVGAPEGPTTLLARAGDPAAFGPPGTSHGFLVDGPVLSPSGRVAFRSVLTGFGPDRVAAWTGQPGDLGLIALSGESVPGGAPGETWISPGVIGIAGDGIALVGDTASLWLGVPGDLELVVRSGDPAPGAEPGVVFQHAGSYATINRRSQVAFHGTLAGPGVSSRNAYGLWTGGPGTLQLVARGGMPAPGAPGGTEFHELEGPVLGDAGDIAFIASLKSGMPGWNNRTGLWLGSPGDLRMVAVEEGQAPGQPAGVGFGAFDGLGGLVHVATNAAGQVALQQHVAGPGVNATNDRGIWATDLQGQLVLVAREGGVVDLNPDPLVTENAVIQSLRFDMLPESFNAKGQIVFRAQLLTPGGTISAVMVARVDGCPADLTTSATVGHPGHGVIDGSLNTEDFFYYLTQFGAGVPGVADLTSTAIPGQPGYATPDGALSNDDFFFYLSLYSAGC